MAALQTDFHSR